MPSLQHIDALAPDAHVSADILDQTRDQALHVLDGALHVVYGTSETVLSPGQSLQLGAGLNRRIWNAGADTVRFVVDGRAWPAGPKFIVAA